MVIKYYREDKNGKSKDEKDSGKEKKTYYNPYIIFLILILLLLSDDVLFTIEKLFKLNGK